MKLDVIPMREYRVCCCFALFVALVINNVPSIVHVVVYIVLNWYPAVISVIEFTELIVCRSRTFIKS